MARFQNSNLLRVKGNTASLPGAIDSFQVSFMAMRR